MVDSPGKQRRNRRRAAGKRWRGLRALHEGAACQPTGRRPCAAFQRAHSMLERIEARDHALDAALQIGECLGLCPWCGARPSTRTVCLLPLAVCQATKEIRA